MRTFPIRLAAATLALIFVAGCDSSAPGGDPPPPFVSAFVGTYAGTRVTQNSPTDQRTDNVRIDVATVEARNEVVITIRSADDPSRQPEVLTGTYTTQRATFDTQLPDIRVQFEIVPSGAVTGSGTFDAGTGAQRVAGTVAISGSIAGARFDLDRVLRVTTGSATVPAGTVLTTQIRTARS